MNLKDIFDRAEEHPAYWAQRLYLSFVKTVTQAMKEAGLSRSQLAEKVGAKPSWITRVLNTNKEENITIHTISRLALAIGRRPVLVYLKPDEDVFIVAKESVTAIRDTMIHISVIDRLDAKEEKPS